MKKIAILGSTGSIGTQTLDVVRNNGDIRVVGISAGHNVDKAEEQRQHSGHCHCRDDRDPPDTGCY